MALVEITAEQMRDALVEQFRWMFSLSEADAAKAGDEAMADPAFVEASRSASTKLVEIAVRYGFKIPPSG